MASPIVAVLKGSSGEGGVRLAFDYRFVNHRSQGDADVTPHLLDSIQKVGAARNISVWGCSGRILPVGHERRKSMANR
jgi:hypothetical protein